MNKNPNTITLSMPRIYFKKAKLCGITRKDLTNVMRLYIEEQYLQMWKDGLLNYKTVTDINTKDPD